MMRSTESINNDVAPCSGSSIRRRPVRKVNIILYWSGIALLLLVVIGYNYEIVRPAVSNYTIDETYSQIANIHDHLEYEKAMADLIGFSNSDLNYFGNVAGISAVYYILMILLGLDDVISASLLVNCAALIISAALHLRIFNRFAKRGSAYTFFLNLPIIYFCQLVGKDMLYITILYAMLLLVLQRKWIGLALLAIVAAIVRIQAVMVCVFVFVLWFWPASLRRRLLIIYVMSALAGAYVSTSGNAIGLDADLGSGVSWIVFELNATTRMGSLFLNPIRTLQYVAEFALTPFSFLGGNTPYFNLFLAPFLFYFILHFNWVRHALIAVHSPATQFLFVLMLVLLVVPIINLRYFVVLLPFMVMAMLLGPSIPSRRVSRKPEHSQCT